MADAVEEQRREDEERKEGDTNVRGGGGLPGRVSYPASIFSSDFPSGANLSV